MRFHNKKALTSAALALMFLGTDAYAGGGAGVKFLGGDFSFNGFIRLETAVATGSENPYNNNGDLFNGVTVHRIAGNPLNGYRTALAPGGALGSALGTVNIGAVVGGGSNPLGVSNSIGVADDFTRYVDPSSNDLHYHTLRFEATPTLAWGDFSLISRIRALYDPGKLGYDEYDPRIYSYINGGQTSGVKADYQLRPNLLGYQVDNKRNPVPLEWSGRNYSVDFPALFLQYNHGPLTLRLGNQTVAWGQTLFFRVFDTANGLDLRRHLILGRALEEYADQRESALGARLTYQVSDQIIADAFVQKFQPTIYPNPNTPYNVIPAEFTIHDRYFDHNYDWNLNYGLRVKGEFGGFAVQAAAVRRYNPDGVFRWTQSGVNKSLPNSNALGAAFNQYCNTVLGTGGAGCGPILAKTPFEVAPAGVFSAEEWFYYAGNVRLDGLDGLNRAVDQFPASQQLLAQTIGRDVNAANNELDAFFIAGEGLHGHLDREYFAENVFSLGGTYVVDAEPGSILDQLIINLETQYQPHRIFTAIDLRQEFHKENEAQAALVLEKYQRFSNAFPATYLVFQYLYKQRSDLFGRLLTGYGSEDFTDQGVVIAKSVPTSANPTITPGIHGGAHYAVLAFLQPFPNYIWEVSAATLIDPRGAVLVQPGVQWKPQGNITVNLFYNYINGHAWGPNSNDNLLSTAQFANEVTLRLGYQF